MHDLVVRGGTIVDGLGGPPFTGDIAVTEGRITEVGRVDGPARRTIDADGLLVTPGFVDVHTHYDGQATWDSQLAPSCWHGVTTVVVGNCGVGFAPVHPGGEQELIELMEGVEDIPGTALWEGIDWQWESFPEYLDALDRRPRMVDVGTHVPHAAMRGVRDGCARRYRRRDRRRPRSHGRDHVRRDGRRCARGVDHRASSLTTRAGATRSRARSPTRRSCPRCASVLRERGTGVFEVVPRGMDGEVGDAAHAELDLLGRLAARRRHPPHLLGRADAHRARPVAPHPRPVRRMARRRGPDLPTGGEPRHRHPVRAPEPEQRVLHPARLSGPRRPPPRGPPGPHARAGGAGRGILAEPNGEWDHPLASFVYETFSNMLPVRRTARLGTDPGRHHGRGGGERGTSGAGGRLRLPGAGRRSQPGAVPVHQLLQLQPGRRARHAHAPGVGVGARRRRRALRRGRRRERSHAHAHALGARPATRPADRPAHARCGG